MKIKPIILGALVCAMFGARGCGGYYTAYPGYGPYYGGYGPGPYYGSPGSVAIAVGDRPYYVVAPATGMDARITFGDQVTGGTGTARKSGFTAITSCEDTEPRECLATAASAGYQAVTSPPSRPRKAPTSISRRSWRFR